MESHTNNKTLPQKQGVIITVYVESPKLQNIHHSHKTKTPILDLHNNINPTNSTTGGYDRRAQLLAYSRNLRNENPLPKSKKLKWKVRSEAPTVQRTALQRWRYERVGAMREERTEVVDQPCRPKCLGGRSRKKSTSKSGSSSIFRKLKSLLGELSKGCERSDDQD